MQRITVRKPQVAPCEKFPVYVNLYGIVNKYLGPEEGDRYGLAGTLKSSSKVNTQDALETLVRALLPNMNKGQLYHVWDEIRIEDLPGKSFEPQYNYE